MKSTPRFNIKYPEGADPARDFPLHTEAMALSIESALVAAGVPGTSNPDIRVCPSATARNSYYGSPSTTSAKLALQARGPLAIRTDTGWIETYYADYNATTNPQGATPAGWYPVAGTMPMASAKRSDNPQPLTSGAWTNYSANAIWTEVQRVGFAPYADGWPIPITGRYLVDVSVASDGAGMFGGVSTDPSGTGRASLEVEATTGTPAFSIGKLNILSEASLAAGTKLYFKSTANAAGNLWRSSQANDAGHFNLRYLGPKRG